MADADITVGVTLLQGTFERLTLQPGDTVIVKIHGLLNREQTRQIQQHVKDQLKIDRVLILDQTGDFSIMSTSHTDQRDGPMRGEGNAPP
mgnify:CR=1 FL=1